MSLVGPPRAPKHRRRNARTHFRYLFQAPVSGPVRTPLFGALAVVSRLAPRHPSPRTRQHGFAHNPLGSEAGYTTHARAGSEPRHGRAARAPEKASESAFETGSRAHQGDAPPLAAWAGDEEATSRNTAGTPGQAPVLARRRPGRLTPAWQRREARGAPRQASRARRRVSWAERAASAAPERGEQR